MSFNRISYNKLDGFITVLAQCSLFSKRESVLFYENTKFWRLYQVEFCNFENLIRNCQNVILKIANFSSKIM